MYKLRPLQPKTLFGKISKSFDRFIDKVNPYFRMYYAVPIYYITAVLIATGTVQYNKRHNLPSVEELMNEYSFSIHASSHEDRREMFKNLPKHPR